MQKTRGEEGQMTPLLRLVAGATAGTIAMSATYPLVSACLQGSSGRQMHLAVSWHSKLFTEPAARTLPPLTPPNWPADLLSATLPAADG